MVGTAHVTVHGGAGSTGVVLGAGHGAGAGAYSGGLGATGGAHPMH